jgi:hypothetical protein
MPTSLAADQSKPWQFPRSRPHQNQPYNSAMGVTAIQLVNHRDGVFSADGLHTGTNWQACLRNFLADGLAGDGSIGRGGNHQQVCPWSPHAHPGFLFWIISTVCRFLLIGSCVLPDKKPPNAAAGQYQFTALKMS